MAIITLPTITAIGATMRLIRSDITLQTFSGASFVVQNTSAVWALSFPLNIKRLDEARAWQAALVQLAKPANQFEVTPPGWVNGLNYNGPQPGVNGASQLGLSLACDSVGLNSPIALKGDFIEIESTGELKMLTEDATSDGTGNVTFYFEPAIRVAPTDGTAVWVGGAVEPQVTMRLVTPVSEWSTSMPDFINMSFDAIEHFGP